MPADAEFKPKSDFLRVHAGARLHPSDHRRARRWTPR